MRKDLKQKEAEILKAYKNYQKYMIVLLCLSVLVAAIVVTSLIKPAITVSYICGFKEHIHNESCYELICDETIDIDEETGMETEHTHSIDKGCYDTNVLICSEPEHIHKIECEGIPEETKSAPDVITAEDETESIITNGNKDVAVENEGDDVSDPEITDIPYETSSETTETTVSVLEDEMVIIGTGTANWKLTGAVTVADAEETTTTTTSNVGSVTGTTSVSHNSVAPEVKLNFNGQTGNKANFQIEISAGSEDMFKSESILSAKGYTPYTIEDIGCHNPELSSQEAFYKSGDMLLEIIAPGDYFSYSDEAQCMSEKNYCDVADGSKDTDGSQLHAEGRHLIINEKPVLVYALSPLKANEKYIIENPVEILLGKTRAVFNYNANDRVYVSGMKVKLTYFVSDNEYDQIIAESDGNNWKWHIKTDFSIKSHDFNDGKDASNYTIYDSGVRISEKDRTIEYCVMIENPNHFELKDMNFDISSVKRCEEYKVTGTDTPSSNDWEALDLEKTDLTKLTFKSNSNYSTYICYIKSDYTTRVGIWNNEVYVTSGLPASNEKFIEDEKIKIKDHDEVYAHYNLYEDYTSESDKTGFLPKPYIDAEYQNLDTENGTCDLVFDFGYYKDSNPLTDKVFICELSSAKDNITFSLNHEKIGVKAHTMWSHYGDRYGYVYNKYTSVFDNNQITITFNQISDDDKGISKLKIVIPISFNIVDPGEQALFTAKGNFEYYNGPKTEEQYKDTLSSTITVDLDAACMTGTGRPICYGVVDENGNIVGSDASETPYGIVEYSFNVQFYGKLKDKKLTFWLHSPGGDTKNVISSSIKIIDNETEINSLEYDASQVPYTNTDTHKQDNNLNITFNSDDTEKKHNINIVFRTVIYKPGNQATNCFADGHLYNDEDSYNNHSKLAEDQAQTFMSRVALARVWDARQMNYMSGIGWDGTGPAQQKSETEYNWDDTIIIDGKKRILKWAIQGNPVSKQLGFSPDAESIVIQATLPEGAEYKGDAALYLVNGNSNTFNGIYYDDSSGKKCADMLNAVAAYHSKSSEELGSTELKWNEYDSKVTAYSGGSFAASIINGNTLTFTITDEDIIKNQKRFLIQFSVAVEQIGSYTLNVESKYYNTSKSASQTQILKSYAILPSTGGTGIHIFIIIGSAMVVSSVVILIMKSRSNRKHMQQQI